MAKTNVVPTTPLVLRTHRAGGHFKVCSLCGALNIRENDECFVCRWHGDFDGNQALVELKLIELLRTCPEIDVLPSTPQKLGFWARLWQRFRHRRVRIDLRV